MASKVNILYIICLDWLILTLQLVMVGIMGYEEPL